jgi:hypothetical protein
MFHKQILHIIIGIVQYLSNNSLFVTNLANIINLKSCIGVDVSYIMQHNVQNVYIFFLMSHGNMSCHMTTFLMSPCKLSGFVIIW